MTEYDRRKILTGGLLGLGALSLPSAVLAKSSTSSIKRPGDTSMSRFAGKAPMIPSLAKVMPEAPELMETLVAEFAPVAAKLPSQEVYWLGFNGWMTDRLSGPIMDGKVSPDDIGQQAWAIYASSVWGGIELRDLRRKWDSAPADQSAIMSQAAAFLAKGKQDMADKMTQRLTALRGGAESCLNVLPALIRDNSTTGPVHGMAYNAGVQVVKTEDPPVGRRRPQRPAKPSAVRINTRDFMRVDYDLPTPLYLRQWRSNFEEAVTTDPETYEKIIVGQTGEENLRDLWKRAVLHGLKTWGGESNDKWSDAYFNEALHWSSVLNFGLEAMGLATFVAMIRKDEEAARRAVLINALYVGATPGWGVGMMDPEAQLPTAA